MQSSSNFPSNNIFLNFINPTLDHIDFLRKQPEIFSNFLNVLLENCEKLKCEMKNNINLQEPNFVVFKPQKEYIEIKNDDDYYQEISLKRLKINENQCIMKASLKSVNENNTKEDSGAKENTKEQVFINLTQSKEKKISMEKMSLQEKENDMKKINSFSIVMEHPCENDSKYDVKAPLNKISIENYTETNNDNKKKSAIFAPKQSLNKKESNSKRKSRLSINLSQHFSNMIVDPENAKRRSILLDQKLARQSLDEMLMSLKPTKKSIEKNCFIPQNKSQKNSNDSEQFFSLEQPKESVSNSNKIIQQEKEIHPLISNNFLESEEKMNDSENENNNYEITDHSSNESSNDGSYCFQWKELPEFDSYDENPFKCNETSTNPMNFNFTSNNPQNMYFGSFNQNSMNMNSNNLFFSQTTPIFGLFDNSTNWNQVQSQTGLAQFATVNYENNAFNKEKKMNSKLLSPKKSKKKLKKLFCNKKSIPDWAADMNEIKKKILEQKNVDTNLIFGEFIVENLDLGIIFEIDNWIGVHRGSSANWKGDQTPDTSFRPLIK